MLRRLRDAAEELLPSTSTTTLDRLERTLRAGAATAEGRRLLKEGRLTEDLEPPGFEAFGGIAPVAPRHKRARSAVEDRKQLRRQVEGLREKKRKADENAKRRADEAAELERRAREAQRAAKEAERAAARSRRQADDAAEQARRLHEELSELQSS